MYNGFPISYPQMMMQTYNQQPAQGMSPPTIHADIVQVNGEKEAMDFPVAAGSSQMMMDKDDTAIYVKTAFINVQPVLDVFRKMERQEQPQKEFVTREELEAALEAMKEKEAAK